MSDQSNQQVQPAQTPYALRQSMLGQLKTSKKAIQELSDEEVDAVAGGYMIAYPMQVTPLDKTTRLAEPGSQMGIKPMIAASNGSVQPMTVRMIDKTDLMM